jgi:hypothetical protein
MDPACTGGTRFTIPKSDDREGPIRQNIRQVTSFIRLHAADTSVSSHNPSRSILVLAPHSASHQATASQHEGVEHAKSAQFEEKLKKVDSPRAQLVFSDLHPTPHMPGLPPSLGTCRNHVEHRKQLGHLGG